MPESALSYLEATAYGCIQGLTEFLPVSSSGHLALAHQLGLGAIDDQLMRPFSVFLHLATLLAVLLAFRREIWRALQHIDKLMLRNIALSVLPAVCFGLLASKWIGKLESSMLLLSLSFFVTATLLLITDRILLHRVEDGSASDRSRSILSLASARQAGWIGLGQALALFPGVSRSGASLCAAILSGIEAERAFAYSFLVGIPLIAGAALHEFLLAGESLAMITAIGWGPMLWAMCCSLGSGLAAIAILRLVIRRRYLSVFSLYCAVLAGMCLVFVIWE